MNTGHVSLDLLRAQVLEHSNLERQLLTTYYIIEASVLNSGSMSNTASATGSGPNNTNDVSDVGDDGDDTDGNTMLNPNYNNNYHHLF